MTFENIITVIENHGGHVLFNSHGSHTDKDLGKLIIDFGEWRFNAWFNVRTNTFHTPCYYFGYKGLITNMTINNGLDTMINKSNGREN